MTGPGGVRGGRFQERLPLLRLDRCLVSQFNHDHRSFGASWGSNLASWYWVSSDGCSRKVVNEVGS